METHTHTHTSYWISFSGKDPTQHWRRCSSILSCPPQDGGQCSPPQDVRRQGPSQYPCVQEGDEFYTFQRPFYQSLVLRHRWGVHEAGILLPRFWPGWVQAE